MKVVLHFKDGKDSTLDERLTKFLIKNIDFNSFINLIEEPSNKQTMTMSMVSKILNIKELKSIEVVLNEEP